jgi:hypothetical protein
MVSAPARRIAALYAIERGASHRRACALMQVSRSTLKYVLTLPMKNAPVVNAMRKLSGQYPRYGYRRVNVFLERDGSSLATTSATDSGPRMACRCRASGHADVLRPAGHVHLRRPGRIRYGATILYSTPAPTGSR